MSGSIARRRLGRTGLTVAELGLGAMDTPHSSEAAATVHAALDLGIDFVDTAREYEGSEFLLGQVMRERGGKAFVLASKSFRRTGNGVQWDVDRSLKVLGVERIDIYQLHDVSTPAAWDEVRAENGALDGLKVAQYRGLVGHIGVSSHNTNLLRELITCGEFGTVMLEYSAFFTETAPLIELANQLDVGVIAMRPVGGSGRTSTMRSAMAAGNAGVVTPENLLRYVLSNPGVSVAIPGARFPSRIAENVATVASFVPMEEEEKRELEAAAARFYE